ncbi:excisionase [Massilia sp. CMS3.1]
MEHAPHINTLRRWVHDGRIYPQAVKIGKLWCVRKDAAYLPD